MKKEQGRKALIILSDGVDHGSRETLVSAIEDSQKADTIVYSILFRDDEGYGGGPGFGMGGPMGGGPMGGGRRGGGQRMPERVDGKKILEQISRETGGRLFEVSKKEPIDKIYAQIEEELRNQYSIGYPVAKDAPPGYHRLLLTSKKKDLIVQGGMGTIWATEGGRVSARLRRRGILVVDLRLGAGRGGPGFRPRVGRLDAVRRRAGIGRRRCWRRAARRAGRGAEVRAFLHCVEDRVANFFADHFVAMP